MMFIFNLRIAWRNLLKSKTISLINIGGLTIGLTASLLLLLYVSYEWNYDKQYEKSKDIYQVMVNFYDTNHRITGTTSQTGDALMDVLKAEMPEVVHAARVHWDSKRLLANGRNSFKVIGRYADPDLLNIFNYDFISGNPQRVFSDPNSILLTESTARKLFGTTDVLNRSIRFENQADLKVTAVIRDLPANVTYNFDCLTSWQLFQQLNPWAKQTRWHDYSIYNLITLKKGTDIQAFNQKIQNLIRRHAPSKSTDATPFIYPLSRLHLYGNFEGGVPSGGLIEQVSIFTGLALGILLIACINFMNLATARSQKRAKEVGIKKTIGATRGSLVIQFLCESFLLTTISFVLAIISVELLLPVLNRQLEINMEINYNNGYYLAAVLTIVCITGLLAGSYPALYLSAFNPIETLKKTSGRRGGLNLNFRQALVVFQFGFAVVLIIATAIIYKQLQFIKNKPMGYQSAALVEMPHEGLLYLKYDLLKTQLLNSGAVVAMCQSSGSISQQNSNSSGVEWTGMPESGYHLLFNQLYTTIDFVRTNKLRLVAGRDFQKGLASDSTAVMLNETAVKKMGLKNPLGQILKHQGKKRHVVGVFEDIAWGDPGKRERAMLIAFNPENSDVITMRLNTGRSVSDNLATISRITKALNPDFPVEIKFLDDLVAEKFQSENILGLLANVFGGLAIFISCMGLFGLSAFSAEQRTKEIGVRKVLGASVFGIIRLLSLSFIRTVMLAVVFAFPVAYLLMNNWLMRFDYQTSIGLPVFVFTAVSTVLIAFLTVSWQAYRAAKTNPVDALKYE